MGPCGPQTRCVGHKFACYRRWNMHTHASGQLVSPRRGRVCASGFEPARQSGSRQNPNHPQNLARRQTQPASSGLQGKPVPAGAPGKKVQSRDNCTIVTFWLQYQAEYGQQICVVGSAPGLGSWMLESAPRMSWNEGHRWSTTVEVSQENVVEYKYVVLQPDGKQPLHWQQGNNAVLAIMPEEYQVEVFDNWYDPSSSSVAPQEGARSTRSERLAFWSQQMNSTVGRLKHELRATRMDAFQAQQDMRDSLQQVQDTQEALLKQVRDNERMASKIHEVQEKNRRLQLQLMESQTLFQEVMAEARDIILSSVEADDASTNPSLPDASLPDASQLPDPAQEPPLPDQHTERDDESGSRGVLHIRSTEGSGEVASPPASNSYSLPDKGASQGGADASVSSSSSGPLRDAGDASSDTPAASPRSSPDVPNSSSPSSSWEQAAPASQAASDHSRVRGSWAQEAAATWMPSQGTGRGRASDADADSSTQGSSRVDKELLTSPEAPVSSEVDGEQAAVEQAKPMADEQAQNAPLPQDAPVQAATSEATEHPAVDRTGGRSQGDMTGVTPSLNGQHGRDHLQQSAGNDASTVPSSHGGSSANGSSHEAVKDSNGKAHPGAPLLASTSTPAHEMETLQAEQLLAVLEQLEIEAAEAEEAINQSPASKSCGNE